MFVAKFYDYVLINIMGYCTGLVRPSLFGFFVVTSGRPQSERAPGLEALSPCPELILNTFHCDIIPGHQDV